MQVSWDGLNAQIAVCEQCELCRGIHHKVPGQGDPRARLMLIGEGPGAEEDLQGLAFVGAAGQLLTKMLAAIGLTRQEVYICNVVKCRPPHNRAPLPEEAAACMPFLRAQFSLVRPQVIVLLGATAAKTLLRPDFRITREHGQFVEKGGILFTPLYHPSALLRDETKRPDTFSDLKALQAKVREVCTRTL